MGIALQGLPRLGADAGALLLAALAVSRWGAAEGAVPLAGIVQALVRLLFTAGGIGLLGGYRAVALRSPESELESVAKGVALAAASLALAQGGVAGWREAFVAGLLWLGCALPVVVAGRCLIRVGCARLWRAGRGAERVVLLGSRQTFERVRENAGVRRYAGFMVVECETAERTLPECRAAIERLAPGAVFVDPSCWPVHEEGFEQLLGFCLERGIAVELLCPAIRGADRRLMADPALGTLRLTARAAWSRRAQQACKWGIDRVLGVVGSVVTVAIAPVIWLLVAVEDPGPLFHRREYVGCDGRIHYYRKFRTMLVDADEILRRDPALAREYARNHKLRHDPRVLRVGAVLRRLSLDEFPQFFSVLTGQLSFVGPRVISGAERERYGEHLAKRQTVKPGLTGYWQTMGRQTTSYQERVLMDMYYIDHWSIWMDLTIILRTFAKVLKQEGAY